MKQSTFTEEQVVAILRQAEKGDTIITALCRQYGISENSFNKWRQKWNRPTCSLCKVLW